MPVVNSQAISPLFEDKLSHFYRVWEMITTDKWVLSTVGIGLCHPIPVHLFSLPSHSISLQGPLSQVTSADPDFVFWKSQKKFPFRTGERDSILVFFLIPTLRERWNLFLTSKFSTSTSTMRFKTVTLATILPVLDHND